MIAEILANVAAIDPQYSDIAVTGLGAFQFWLLQKLSRIETRLALLAQKLNTNSNEDYHIT